MSLFINGFSSQKKMFVLGTVTHSFTVCSESHFAHLRLIIILFLYNLICVLYAPNPLGKAQSFVSLCLHTLSSQGHPEQLRSD